MLCPTHEIPDTLIATGLVQRDFEFHNQIRRSASAAPRLIAEGFGRYLPGDFSRYLREANAELKETFESLRDGVDRGYFTPEQSDSIATTVQARLKGGDEPDRVPKDRQGAQRRIPSP